MVIVTIIPTTIPTIAAADNVDDCRGTGVTAAAGKVRLDSAVGCAFPNSKKEQEIGNLSAGC